MRRFLRYALLALVVLAPLPLGSNRPLPWSAIGVVVGLLLLGRASLVLRGEASLTWHRALWGPLLLFAAVMGWILAQTFWPRGDDALWATAQAALGQPVAAHPGLTPEAALVGSIRLLSYVALFWLALQHGRDPERAWQFVRWFVVASLVYAVYGLVTYLSGNEWLLWYPRWAYPADLTATFVNRNSYATCSALGMLAAAALAIRAYRAKFRVSDRSMTPPQRAIEAFIGPSLAYWLATLVIAMAWLQTHSRMGFVAGGVGFLAFLMLVRGVSAGGRALILVVLFGVAGFLIAISGGGTIARLEATQSFDRAELFAQVIRGIEDAPWAGHGYGSFASVFPMFREAGFAPDNIFTEAHSSYLELAFELGIPGALALVAAITWVALFTLRGALTRQRNALLPALAFAASVVIGVHSLTDFSAQIPAVALSYGLLLGIGTAQSWSFRAAAAERSGAA